MEKPANKSENLKSLEERANIFIWITIDRGEELCIEQRFSRFFNPACQNWRLYYLTVLSHEMLVVEFEAHSTFPFYIATIFVFVIPNSKK